LGVFELEAVYTVLVDRPDWAERYIADGLFQEDPYLRSPEVYQPGIFFWSDHGSERYREGVGRTAKETIGSDTNLVQIAKNKGVVEFFGFSSGSQSRLLSTAFNHPALLREFGAHFKKELAPILFQMMEEPGSLPELKGEDYYEQVPIAPEPTSAFVENLGCQKELEQIGQLSMQEKKCMALLVEGKTAKETGVLLGLSSRTIESYLDHIKTKWGCWSKQELFQIGSRLTTLNLLSRYLPKIR
jgi:DNA-binding CsgD family transcriptional regulator